jgi:hypothetical protein
VKESDLCAEFMAWARGQGHRCYPEWGGWDILVVTSAGVHVGVEAKMRAGIDVLEQAMWPAEDSPGPTYHAVLVPTAGGSFKSIARRLKVWVMEWSPKPAWLAQYRQKSDTLLPAGVRHLEWIHQAAQQLPPVEELNQPAGVPSPSSLTQWKLKAIKLILRLESRGYVTSKDFNELGISMGSTWVGRWIEWDGTKIGRRHRYVAIAEPRSTRPDKMHPEVADAIRAQVAENLTD